jgi:hypothetical protein
MKGFNKIDKIEFNDKGELIAVKGHIEPVKVIEITEMNRKFLNHQFKKETLMEIHNAEWKVLDNIIDYAGG